MAKKYSSILPQDRAPFGQPIKCVRQVVRAADDCWLLTQTTN
jgi:hypothetical protein